MCQIPQENNENLIYFKLKICWWTIFDEFCTSKNITWNLDERALRAFISKKTWYMYKHKSAYFRTYRKMYLCRVHVFLVFIVFSILYLNLAIVLISIYQHLNLSAKTTSNLFPTLSNIFIYYRQIQVFIQCAN